MLPPSIKIVLKLVELTEKYLLIGQAKRSPPLSVQSRFRVIYIYVYYTRKWFPLQNERGRSSYFSKTK